MQAQPEWQTVTKIYQAGEPENRWDQSLENQTLVGKRWCSRPISLFGIRLYKGLLPTISPHGTLRVAVPFSDVIESGKDFLLPLRGKSPHRSDADRLYRSTNLNDYFEFVYIREEDIRTLTMSYDMWEWLQQWKLENHSYVRLEDGTLSYRIFNTVGRRQVWYDILVAYPVEFDTDPVDDRTEWEPVDRANSSWPNRFDLTEPFTEVIVRELPIF